METKIKTNQIDYDFNGGGGGGNAFYPNNNDELMEWLDENDSGIIDFSKFEDDWDENGYEINNKDIIIRNLNVNNEHQQFPWFQKPLFKFYNINSFNFPTFLNCVFDIHDIDLDGINNLTALIEGNNVDDGYHKIYFSNCMINVNNVQNAGETIKIIQLNDIMLTVDKCDFNFSGDNQMSEGVFISSHTSEGIEDQGKTSITIKYGRIGLGGFNDTSHCIQYDDSSTSGSRVNVQYSELSSDGETIVVPNNSNIDLNFSRLDKVTISESTEQFTQWQTNTTYNPDDLLVWENPTDSDDRKYFKVINQFTTPNDIYDTDTPLNNDDIEWYYNAEVNGNIYDAFDPNGRIRDFQGFGWYRVNIVDTNRLTCNETNNFWIKMQDQNINGGNDTDVLQAISELASRVATLEQGQ